MAKSKKAVAQSTVEQTEVITKLIDGIGVVEVEVNVDPVVVEGSVGADQVLADEVGMQDPTEQEVDESNQPSMLASMLQQEVKPLEEVKAETEQKPVVKVEKNQGVGAFVKKLIAEGLTNTAILKIVHEQYGNTNTTYACVAWYRNKMKKAGVVAKNMIATNIVTEMLKTEEPEAEESKPEAEA